MACRIALVLGGGGARGLAHIGVLAVLEAEGLRPAFLVGTSMGGVVGALAAAGRPATEIQAVARGFRFPRWFLPGCVVSWDGIFAPAARALGSTSFEDLQCPLAVVAVDLETGKQVVLHGGPLLPSLRATCAVPGVLAPIEIGGRWLVDGALVNVLPVDVAAMAQPDVVVAVRVGGHGNRPMPTLRASWARLATRAGELIPNPLSARAGFEVLVRSTEIALDRQSTLAAAMVEPQVLVDVQVGDIGLRDFQRLDDAVEAGRQAAQAALPALRRAIHRLAPGTTAPGRLVLHTDPICDMVVNPATAEAVLSHGDQPLFFCSATCRDAYLRRLERAPAPGGERRG